MFRIGPRALCFIGTACFLYEFCYITGRYHFMKALAKIFSFFLLAVSVALAVTVFLDDHTMVRRSYVNLENDD